MSFQNEVDFCLNFLRLQNSFEDSTIFSPISILNNLAAIFIGADENTAKEILNVVGKNEDITAIIKYYSNFVKRQKIVVENLKDTDTQKIINETPLKKLKIEDDEKSLSASSKNIDPDASDQTNSSNVSAPEELTYAEKIRKRGIRGRPPSKVIIKDDDSPGFQIFITNQLFVDKQTSFNGNVIDLMKNNFDIRLQTIDFKENKDEISKIINKSIFDATKEKISSIIKSEDDIKEDAESLILINATYFKGKWAFPFGIRITAMFNSKIPRKMDFISQKICHTPFNVGEDWKSVGIPYKEHKQWMFIVLPNVKDGLQNLINKMDYEMFKECTKNTSSSCVQVTMPAFEVFGNYNTAKDLKKLGIIDLFDSAHCNLSKMIHGSYPQNNYFLGQATHEAVIKIDEYGTCASEYTRDRRYAGCGPSYFEVDSPFLYFIVSAKRQKGENGRYINEVPTEILFTGTYC